MTFDLATTCLLMEPILSLSRANFRDVVVFAHVGEVLVEILYPVAVRLVSRLRQSLDIDLLPLLYVSPFGGRQLMVVGSSLAFLTQLALIIHILLFIRFVRQPRPIAYASSQKISDRLAARVLWVSEMQSRADKSPNIYAPSSKTDFKQ